MPPGANVIDFIHALRWDDLPEAVVHQARRLLLDLVGVAAAGSRTDLSRILRDHAAAHFAAGTSGPGARMMFDGREVSPVGAAMAGAGTIDSVDAHDGHKLTKGHMGVTVLPALLAFADADRGRVSAREFLVSLVLGYEIGTRAGIALHGTVPDYHTSGAWNALAAAAIGARLMGLDADRTRHALGIAEYHGPRSQMMRCIAHPTMLKDGSAWGAVGGVSAAFLARDGFTGAPAVSIEDAPGYWGDLGTRWTILEQYVKPYPVCRWAQPAVRGALELRDRAEISPDDIVRIEVRSFAEAVALAARTPSTTEEAQYSLPFPVAVALVHGDILPEHIDEPALSDPAIRRLSADVSLVEDPALSKRFPAERLAAVTVELKDGRRLESGTVAALGDSEEPLSDAHIAEKFEKYAAPSIGRAATNAMRNLVWTFGKDGSGHGDAAASLCDALLSPPGAARLTAAV